MGLGMVWDMEDRDRVFLVWDMEDRGMEDMEDRDRYMEDRDRVWDMEDREQVCFKVLGIQVGNLG